MVGTLAVIVITAILSSALTLGVAYILFQRLWRLELERRLKDFHDDMGRMVEHRVKRAVVEALSDINTVDVLRDSTWKAARSGADLVSDGLNAVNALLGKRRRE